MADGNHSTCKKIPAKLLKILGIICLITACLPSYSSTTEGNTQAMRIGVGLPFSPWILFVREVTEQRSGSGNFTSSFNQRLGVEFISWSVFLLFVAQLLFFVASKISPSGATAQ